MSLLTNSQLIAQLSRSEIYKDYERAFGETTGMPLTLRGIEDFHLAHHGKRYENAFCALMAQLNKTCAACLNAQQKTLDPTTAKTRTVMCFANLYESAVPLRVGGDLLGFLQTGEVMLRKPTRSQFSNIAQFLTDLATKGELKEAEKTWFQTKVLSHKQYESVLRLLKIFALHLGIVANQLVTQRAHAEPPSITRARQFMLIIEVKTDSCDRRQGGKYE